MFPNLVRSRDRKVRSGRHSPTVAPVSIRKPPAHTSAFPAAQISPMRALGKRVRAEALQRPAMCGAWSQRLPHAHTWHCHWQGGAEASRSPEDAYRIEPPLSCCPALASWRSRPLGGQGFDWRRLRLEGWDW